ncbi:MAG: GNAT family N-acetyltransferase [Defluviitaleaceae bacterium]|nr:GNAT family N-acetyltransferase [Defluviitaleaceae bacterium]
MSEYSAEELERLAVSGGEALLAHLETKARALACDSFAPMSQFWLVSGGEVVGVGDIRHCLIPALEFFGGHIAYGVKDGRRREGLGTALLGELLVQARTFGIKTALLTCAETNIASRRVIEKNGGILLDTVSQNINGDNRLGRRYLAGTGFMPKQNTLANHALLYSHEGNRRLMLMPAKAVDECGQITSYYFHIMSEDENTGWIVFRAADEQRLYYDGNIGYFVKPEHRGKGFAEGACRLMGAKLARLGIPRVVITCDSGNAPSRRVCQKLGAKFLEIALKPPPGKKIKCRYIFETGTKN